MVSPEFVLDSRTSGLPPGHLVKCPEGKKVLGGGPQIKASSSPDHRHTVHESFPISDTEWFVRINNEGPPGPPGTNPLVFVVWAVCAATD